MKYIHLGVGIGDCLLFRNLVPELVAKYKQVTIISNYNQIFVGMGVELMPYNKEYGTENVYDWCHARKWKKHLLLAYKEMYEL